MAEVHYFPRYSQKENFITNNTLLLLYRLFDWNRARFQEFLLLLVGGDDDAPLTIGLQITQQRGTGQSVLDGYLSQAGFRIAIETKRSAKTFYPDQIQRHLRGIEAESRGFLLLLAPQKVSLAGKEWSDVKKKAKKKGIRLIPVTFEEISRNFKSCLQDRDEEMHALVRDFEAFCSEEKLFETDSTLLFIPPCGQSLEINRSDKLYFCPSSWNRRNAKYIGFYADRSVRAIGAIKKIAYCESQGSKVTARNEIGDALELTKDEENRILDALSRASKENGWAIEQGYKFFLCDDVFETDFRKETAFGIQGHRYVDLRETVGQIPSKPSELAQLLNTKTWS